MKGQQPYFFPCLIFKYFGAFSALIYILDIFLLKECLGFFGAQLWQAKLKFTKYYKVFNIMAAALLCGRLIKLLDKVY